MSVMIIDYGMGNLLSVKRAFEKCGANVLISSDPNDIKKANHLILPGVGAFKDGMANLKSKEWIPAIKKAVHENGVPILGICLGMQLLADKSFEGQETQGLGLISGEIKKLQPQNSLEKIPHVGWNELSIINRDLLLMNINNNTDFYFVHSFHFIPNDENVILSLTPYCGNFVSSIGKDNIYGVQFHPEKSHRPGFKLIENFLKL